MMTYLVINLCKQNSKIAVKIHFVYLPGNISQNFLFIFTVFVHYSFIIIFHINRHNLKKLFSTKRIVFVLKKIMGTIRVEFIWNRTIIIFFHKSTLKRGTSKPTYATPHSGFLVTEFGGKQLRPGWRQSNIHTPKH